MEQQYRIKSFADQDSARVKVCELAARCVSDILYLLDTATGPEGSDGLDAPPDPETARLYSDFRSWFGPQVGVAIQGLVVGPLLSRLGVNRDGHAFISDEEYRHYLSDTDRLVSRARWLCEEIPSLIETYGQLSGSEKSEALEDVHTMLNIDFSEQNGRTAAEALLPTLEQWFLWANDGAKIMRGDKDAVAALLDSLDSLRGMVRDSDQALLQARKNLDEGETESADKNALRFDLDRTEQKIVRFERKLEKLTKERGKILSALSGLV